MCLDISGVSGQFVLQAVEWGQRRQELDHTLEPQNKLPFVTGSRRYVWLSLYTSNDVIYLLLQSVAGL